MAQQFKISPLIFAILLLAGLLVWLYMPVEQQQQRRGGGDIPVVAQTVELQPFAQVVEALGTANANEAIVVTAQETDKIEALLFDDGDLVTQGQLLVRMNTKEEQARLNELKINLAEAQRQLKRVKNLAKENAASEQLLDEREAEVDALVAQIDIAEAQIADREIRAPFAGLLGVRQVSEGALVRPGDQISTLDDIQTLKVDFSVAERHLPSVRLKQKVAATSVAYPGRVFEGEISHIDSRVDAATRAIRVRARINNSELLLRPGMLLQILVQKSVSESLVVDESALVPIDDKQFVFVIEDGKARKVEVQIGVRKPGQVQIIGGLSSGQQVVVEGTLRLQDGTSVRVVEG
ncbi:efflux RND transporter periplasmic adaptor subunit [Planctobacterium marinum]|uniref:MexH family multidrug efflux RND transporter periplasmic adaptor subunit n=1 Tax=Planctobacterium marinum TaxID=1631968 RepID=A0AA48HR97_9ALTE|nr:MexH family multidrug efflux RND transporter periplasmic adaptor subunit [Planctobacterium marinum]